MNNMYSISTINEFDCVKNYIFFKNDAIGNHIQRTNAWEKHMTELMVGCIKEGYNCLDIGANFGYHSITMAKIIKNKGKVYSFEPMKDFYHLIGANSHLNQLDNIEIYNNAVGETDDYVFILKPNLESPSIINHGDTSINLSRKGDQIKMIKIDGLQLPTINFIKIDVQGCELPVLKGSKNLISQDKPVIVVEIEDCQISKFNNTPKDIIDYILYDLNYDMYQMMTEHPSDFVCVPKNSKINKNFKTFELKQIFSVVDRTPI